MGFSGGRASPQAMLTWGNQHIGRHIWGFSLPALSTCPGATFECVGVCYALRFVFLTKGSLALHMKNWQRASEPDSFVRDLRREINGFAYPTVRIHVSGDFF